MNRQVMLVLGVVCLLSLWQSHSAMAGESEFVISFEDIIPPLDDDSENSEDNPDPSNPIADLGRMTRNLFSFTNKLRSDIRTHTGFAKHHSITESGHSRSRSRHDDGDVDTREGDDEDFEPILDILFDRARSHQKKKHTKKRRGKKRKERPSCDDCEERVRRPRKKRPKVKRLPCVEIPAKVKGPPCEEKAKPNPKKCNKKPKAPQDIEIHNPWPAPSAKRVLVSLPPKSVSVKPPV